MLSFNDSELQIAYLALRNHEQFLHNLYDVNMTDENYRAWQNAKAVTLRVAEVIVDIQKEAALKGKN